MSECLQKFSKNSDTQYISPRGRHTLVNILLGIFLYVYHFRITLCCSAVCYLLLWFTRCKQLQAFGAVNHGCFCGLMLFLFYACDKLPDESENQVVCTFSPFKQHCDEYSYIRGQGFSLIYIFPIQGFSPTFGDECSLSMHDSNENKTVNPIHPASTAITVL